MATKRELVEEIQDIVQDASYTVLRIVRYLNRALREIAGAVPVPLPALEAQGTVSTSLAASYVALPVSATTPAVVQGYHRDLYFCYSAAQNDEVRVYPSLEFLASEDPSMALAGIITAVAVAGANLWYVRRPGVSDTLTLRYFTDPAALVNDSDIPTCLPLHLHEKLLVNMVCGYIFDRIEDGIEGEKTNTNHHKAEFSDAFSQLIYWIGPPHTRPTPINDVLSGTLSDWRGHPRIDW